MNAKVNAEIAEFTAGLLERRLALLTDKQRAFFHRIYPQGVPSDKMVSAIDLCDRTIKKNTEGRETQP